MRPISYQSGRRHTVGEARRLVAERPVEIDGYRADFDSRYNRVLAHFGIEHPHPKRTMEAALGTLTVDAIAARDWPAWAGAGGLAAGRAARLGHARPTPGSGRPGAVRVSSPLVRSSSVRS